MDIRKTFDSALWKSGLSIYQIAEPVNLPAASIGQMIRKRGTVSANKYMEIMEAIGYGLYFRDTSSKATIISEKERRKPIIKRLKTEKRRLIYYEEDPQKHLQVMFACLMKHKKLTLNNVEDMAGTYRQGLEYKIIRRKSIRAIEFFNLVEMIGYEPSFFNLKTGEDLEMNVIDRSLHHGKAVGMSDRVTYDTSSAKLMASSFYADGVNEYGEDGKAIELYQDNEERYFFVEWNKNARKAKIKAVPLHIAKALITQYGLPVKEETAEEHAEEKKENDGPQA